MDEFDTLNSRIPDLQTAILSRLQNKEGNPSSKGKIDPYQLMVNKKRVDKDENFPVVEYDPLVVKELEDYCKKMGIVGFNYGKLHPLVALKMLKARLGDFQGDTPYDERTESGYQKLGTKEASINSGNRQVLHD